MQRGSPGAGLWVSDRLQAAWGVVAAARGVGPQTSWARGRGVSHVLPEAHPAASAPRAECAPRPRAIPTPHSVAVEGVSRPQKDAPGAASGVPVRRGPRVSQLRGGTWAAGDRRAGVFQIRLFESHQPGDLSHSSG